MRTGLTAGLLTLVLGLAACGGSEQLQFAEGSIENPEEFLAAVEQQWRTELADRDATVHDDARCYFARDDVSEVLDEVVYCGPLRHSARGLEESGNSEDSAEPQLARQGVWDTYRFTIAQGDDGLHLANSRLDLLGTDLRVDRTLVRPDGLEPPANAADFAQPEVPTVQSKFTTTTVDEPRMQDTTQATDSALVTPRTIINVDTAGTVAAVEDGNAQKEATEGETLRALTLSFSRGPYANAYDDAAGSDEEVDYVDASVEYFVDIGGDRTPILTDGTPERPMTVIASVPDNGDAELVVAVDGLEQSISFTSGERTSDTAAAFYLEENEAALNTPYPANEQTEGDFEVSQSLNFDQATLTAFHPEHGWAADGHAWLVVTTSQVNFGWNDTDYAVTLERDETATLTMPDGEEIADETETSEYDYFAFGDTLDFTFEVPTEAGTEDSAEGPAEDSGEASTAEFEYEPVLTFASKDGPASPPSGQVTLEPLEFSIDLPGN